MRYNILTVKTDDNVIMDAVVGAARRIEIALEPMPESVPLAGQVETPQEHVRNALAIFRNLPLSLRGHHNADFAAIDARLCVALDQLEGRTRR